MKTFKQFITEANKPKPDAIKTITKNNERMHPGLVYNASYTPSGDIRLHAIHTPEPGKGLGSKLLRGLKFHADKTQKNIRLSPSAQPGREGDLLRFYRRHGFKKIKDSDTMIREPNQG